MPTHTFAHTVWISSISYANTLFLPSSTVFETELLGIEGVAKPDPAAKKVGEKVASAVKEAAEAAKTIVADTDDTQDHNEL